MIPVLCQSESKSKDHALGVPYGAVKIPQNSEEFGVSGVGVGLGLGVSRQLHVVAAYIFMNGVVIVSFVNDYSLERGCLHCLHRNRDQPFCLEDYDKQS